MHLAWWHRVVGWLSVIFLTGAAIASEMRPGVVIVARVEGVAGKIDSAGQRSRLSNADRMTEADSIETGSDASLVAVFQNGCAFKLGPSTLLQIEDFKLVPLKEGAGWPMKRDIESSMRLNLKSGSLIGQVQSVVRSARCELLTAHGTIRFYDDSSFSIVVPDSSMRDAAHPVLRIDVIQGSVHFTTAGYKQDIQAGYALVLAEGSRLPDRGVPAYTPKVVALDAATAESLGQAIGETFLGGSMKQTPR